MLTRHALSTLRRTLTATLILCAALTQAAPQGVSTAADEGLASVSTSDFNTDLATSLANGYATTDNTVFNAQTYSGDEFDSTHFAPVEFPNADFDNTAELEPCTPQPPLTREELALVEMASVVAELASTTADEIKVKTTMEEEDKYVRRRAEEARQRAIEREISNTVEAGVTHAPRTSVAPPAASTATTTIANSTPEILNELVRAASAANEILTAALNVATQAVTNMTAANEATTTRYVAKGEPTIKTAYVPNGEATTTDNSITSTNSGARAAIADADVTLTLMSDVDALPEPSVKWQTSKGALINKTEETTTPTVAAFKVEQSGAAANATIIQSATQSSENKTRNKAEEKIKAESAYAAETAAKNNLQEIPTTITINESATEIPQEGAQSHISVETATFTKTEKPFHFVASSDDFAHDEADNEAAESMQIITKETTTEAAEPTNGDNEVENETFNLYYATVTGAQQQQTTTPAPYNFETNAFQNEAIEIAKYIIGDTTTTGLAQAAEKLKKGVEIEKAKVQELKLGANYEGKQDMEGDHEGNGTITKADNDIVATHVKTVAPLAPLITTTESLETSIHEIKLGTNYDHESNDSTVTTTESLETLIAVESEARAPTQFAIATGEEQERPVELAPFTTASPQTMTVTKAATEVPQQEIVTEISPNDITSTLNSRSQETTIVGDITSETQASQKAEVNFVDKTGDIRAKELLELAQSEILTSGAVVNDKFEREADSETESMTTETPKIIEAIETSTDFPKFSKSSLAEEIASIPVIFQTETTSTEVPVASLTLSERERADSQAKTATNTELSTNLTTFPTDSLTEGIAANPVDSRTEPRETTESEKSDSEEKPYAITEHQAGPVAPLAAAEIATIESTTPFSIRATTNQVLFIVTKEPVTDTIITNDVEKGDGTLDFTTTVINVPLAPFTTTTSPTITEELLPAILTTTKSDSAAVADIGSTESWFTASISTDRTTKTADSALPTTLNSNSETTNTPATANELATEQETNKGDSMIAITTISDLVVETTTTEPVMQTTTETVESEQPLYMKHEQQQQQEPNAVYVNSEVETRTTEVPAEAAKEQEKETTTEQFLYMRVFNQQQGAYVIAGRPKVAEEATTDAAENPAESTDTINNMNEPDSTITMTTPEAETRITTTTAETESTTTTSTAAIESTSSTTNTEASEITTSTTTTTTETPETTTSTTTAEPETTTSITTTTAIPETTTTTTTTTTATPEPETTTTTTTTTTLSPMSLIIAEHEARSLDKTPSRVSRIVNDDGVEVLSGYSIVHRMHAAALAALEAMKGA